MEKNETNSLQTIVVLMVALVFVFWWSRLEVLIFLVVLLGLIGLFFPWLSDKINFLWMKLAWLLSLVVPNILLSIIFFALLFPIALLSRVFRSKDPLFLKNNRDSLFRKMDQSFDRIFFERPW